jgi:transcriptional regulator with XRE-family HTH domain
MTPTRLRALRDELGLSQQDFASLLGVSQVSVSHWETGHTRMRGLHEALFDLLDLAVQRHSRKVVPALRPAGGVAVDVIRVLARLAPLRKPLAVFT